MNTTPFDFLWPVTENGEHVGDLRFTGVTYQQPSWLRNNLYMVYRMIKIEWITKYETNDVTSFINQFGGPLNKYFPDERTISDLIREKYYNPAYEPEKLVTHESNI